MTRIGIIGVGYLGECLAEGLVGKVDGLTLSPRNPDRVRKLADKHGYHVASNNADVVEASDVVLLATRPDDIVSTAVSLPWREGQRAISIAAGIGLETLRQAITPAIAIRAMPIAASRIGESPTAFCPDDPLATEIFNHLGTAHSFDDEEQFKTASIFGAFYALSYAFMDEVSGWAETNGLEAVDARRLTARMMQASASVILNQVDSAPADLLNDLLTPGGITEEGLNLLQQSKALTRWADALDASAAKAAAIDTASQRVKMPEPSEAET